MKAFLVFFFSVSCYCYTAAQGGSWIRINQLGYPPSSTKVAVWCSKDKQPVSDFQLIDSATQKIVFTAKASIPFGAYGPFQQTQRLDFSAFKKPGTYFLKAGAARSPFFRIANDVYKGAADFCLRYMRQQRTGFNPFLKDSCHTRDGYTLYGPMPDSTYVDVVGGWHDASDYLQYVTTSANATYHLLMAYRDFKPVFTDGHAANGLEGSNGIADVLDEAKWGLDWLVKMNPSRNIMFNQIADDRDHISMRIPRLDSQYGRGHERPVYFVSGEPQQRGKFMNNTTGTSSTAAKFASTFALADYIFRKERYSAATNYYAKAFDAYAYAQKKPGVTQTASVKSPYIYAEDNWVDDMELASAAIHNMVINTPSAGDNGYYRNQAFFYARQEPITPWLGTDTAKHYQWYPFINIGHYELAKQLKDNSRDTIINYYRQGINAVWQKAKSNAFYRGIPYIWCSNNLTTSFAIQCLWYKQLTGDNTFYTLEQANFDWLFGCNPWGTSMVYGLPSWGDTPVDPHSAFTHLKNYPIDGGLIDGPVYGSIYKSLIGIKLYAEDEYAPFQSDLAVYHDDYGDYSTNEPTMDGTASLIYLLAAKEASALPINSKVQLSHGAIIRGDTLQKRIALVFTGDEFAEGGKSIASTLQKARTPASFFFTGRFYRNKAFAPIIKQLKAAGHYLGAHSDAHLLYADWVKRDSLLITQQQFRSDLEKNYKAMEAYGINKTAAPFFLPPYEWYNDTIAAWTKQMGLQLINFTPGTLSHADYTTPEAANYRSSETIWNSIMDREAASLSGLNGAILLMHIGAGNKRTDKFYDRLPQLIKTLQEKGYNLVRVDELLTP